eukprot:gnl/MRDRNA2_/MRDRNA2_121596_c0_seq1.p1 gnl/MRDRNA2_/MRDRNA2_121596_c0~~gnl/MRDRNA2_/MRDRNA2_121596_c0_seq1.p1  ORF type:complete len:125 (-),score=19.73 gnl/MRDRNA2_/MRDRNA2_121596_c0_seq1:34-408(-)
MLVWPLFIVLAAATRQQPQQQPVVASAGAFRHHLQPAREALHGPLHGDHHIEGREEHLGFIQTFVKVSGQVLTAVLDPDAEPKEIWGLPKFVWVIIADILAMLVFLACIPLVLNCAKRRTRFFS